MQQMHRMEQVGSHSENTDRNVEEARLEGQRRDWSRRGAQIVQGRRTWDKIKGILAEMRDSHQQMLPKALYTERLESATRSSAVCGAALRGRDLEPQEDQMRLCEDEWPRALKEADQKCQDLEEWTGAPRSRVSSSPPMPAP